MDEASSKFVDRLALEKIIAEKLSQVHHVPSKQPDALREPAFGSFSQPLGRAENGQSFDPYITVLHSPIQTAHPENRAFFLRCHPAKAERGIVLLVHGLFEDNRAMYGFLIGELNRAGYSVYLTTLPFHHERTPAEAKFSGEFFFSADLARTKEAFVQAVLEVRLAYEWLTAHHDAPVFLTGFSMGGTVATAAACANDCFEGVCIVNPASMLSEVIWTSPLCATIKQDLLAAGWERTEIDFVVSSFDPYMMSYMQTDDSRVLMIYALYDQITRPDQYESLITQKQLTNILQYKAGHLNTLRVPRFATDLVQFFERQSASALELKKRTS